MTNKLIVLSGPSGCGKSHYAKRLNEADPFGTIVVSSDDIREILNGDVNDQTDHEAVFRTVDRIVDGALNQGLTPIVDATNLNARNRASYTEAAFAHGVPAELHVFTASLETCLAGQQSRERKVPEDVVVRMVKQRDKDVSRSLFDFLLEGFEAVRFIKRVGS